MCAENRIKRRGAEADGEARRGRRENRSSAQLSFFLSASALKMKLQHTLSPLRFPKSYSCLFVSIRGFHQKNRADDRTAAANPGSTQFCTRV
jgi:hypothetical protein